MKTGLSHSVLPFCPLGSVGALCNQLQKASFLSDQKLFCWWPCCFASPAVEQNLVWQASRSKVCRCIRMSNASNTYSWPQAGWELMKVPKHLQDPGVFWLNLEKEHRSFSIQMFFININTTLVFILITNLFYSRSWFLKEVFVTVRLTLHQYWQCSNRPSTCHQSYSWGADCFPIKFKALKVRKLT